MKFTNQFSNTTPCQSDVAADAWEELCDMQSRKEDRIDDIIERCFDNMDDWDIMLDNIIEDGDVALILSLIRKGYTKNIQEELKKIIADLVEEDFEYYDRNITGDSLT